MSEFPSTESEWLFDRLGMTKATASKHDGVPHPPRLSDEKGRRGPFQIEPQSLRSFCPNPFLQEDRAVLVKSCRRPQRKTRIGSRPGVAAGRLWRKGRIGMQSDEVGKYFQIEIDEGRFRRRRKHDAIEREAAVAGIYVIA